MTGPARPPAGHQHVARPALPPQAGSIRAAPRPQGLPPDQAHAPLAAAARIAAILRAYVPSLNTAEPATSTLAPASVAARAVSGATPPSTSRRMGREPIMARRRRSFSVMAGMNACPP